MIKKIAHFDLLPFCPIFASIIVISLILSTLTVIHEYIWNRIVCTLLYCPVQLQRSWTGFIYCTVFIAPYLLHRIYFRCNSVECSVLLTKVSCAGHTLNGHFFNSSLGFQYEKFFQNTVPPYVSFLLVIGQISAYVWSISYFRKWEREWNHRNQKESLHFLSHFKMVTKNR